MPRFRDLVGLKFNRLSVIAHAGRTPTGKHVWRCECECGTTTEVDGGSLVSGNTMSCGCYLKERITSHGGTGKRSYNTWRAMMRRCYTVGDKDYPRYGGNGVIVYEPWHSYPAFVLDMGEPEERHTLDRIDPYGDYSPTNCRWASLTTQARNTRKRESKSGHRGVYLNENGTWMAGITAAKKKFYGKCRPSVAEALEDRKALEALHWVKS